jgi:hypothetical protein
VYLEVFRGFLGIHWPPKRSKTLVAMELVQHAGEKGKGVKQVRVDQEKKEEKARTGWVQRE